MDIGWTATNRLEDVMGEPALAAVGIYRFIGILGKY